MSETVEAKIKCELCGEMMHVVKSHLTKSHPGVTLVDYREKFPAALLISDLAVAQLRALQGPKFDEYIKMATTDDPKPIVSSATAVTADFATGIEFVKRPLFELFGFPDTHPEMRRDKGKGAPIEITTFKNVPHPEMVPDINANYVHDINDLKDSLMALEENMPLYVYGHKGTGKTEMVEDICARTGRPLLRVQHTANTEESQIVGQWTAHDGSTNFELGPLPLCMINGWTYLADEYDFALPHVTSVYQAVLEGKALFIKEANAGNRLIKPHPGFRFVATGNTNGSGDETGLYAGTNIQNSANFDRFAMMIHKKYLPSDAEIRILMNHTGLKQSDAAKLIQFAEMVRNAYEGRKISDTIGPRALLNIAKIGMRRGSYRAGVERSFSAKLNRVDAEAVNQMAQRIFG